MGVGWQLEGFPVITRMNYGIGINYDAGDTFVGPGGRLVNFNGSHAYHTEDETWIRYVPYKNDGTMWAGTGGCNNGPCYWRATQADGEILEFGTTDNSRIEAVGRGGAVREWALSKVIDTAGNFYTVDYFEDSSGGDYRPVSVAYNQGNGRSKLYTVQFSHEPRNDHAAEFSQSARVDLDRRLKWITVGRDGQLLRKYRLDYEYGATTGSSRLIAFQEYGSDGTSTRPAQSFYWQEGSRNWASFASRSDWGPNSGFTNASRYPLLIGDWNGDGRTDLGRVHNTGTTFQLSTGTGWAPYADDWDGGPNRGFTDANTYPMLVGDWNGDGKTDFGRVNDAGAFFRISTGAGWQGYPDRLNWGPNDGFTDATTYPVLIGDWNGDGKTDIGRVHNWGIQFDVSTGAGWTPYAAGPDWSPNTGFTNASRYPVLAGDWNGDGKTDIARVHNGGLAVALSTGSGWQQATGVPGWGPDSGFMDGNVYPLLTGDWNGDGKTDVGRVHQSGIHFFVSTGAGWEAYAAGPEWSPSQGFSSANDYPIFMGDWNGDGRTDIGRVHNAGVVFRTSTGRGWETFADWAHWGKNEGYVDGNVYPVLSGDWTGEGKSGLGRVDNAGITFITRPGAIPDLMTSTTNVLGGTTTITYQPATLVGDAVRPDAVGCTGTGLQPPLCGNANPSPIPLVTRVAVSDGRDNTYSTRYEYYNLRYHPGTPSVAEHLGFERTTQIDEQLNQKQVTYYSQDKPYHGRIRKEESYAASGQLLGRTMFDYLTLSSTQGTRQIRKSKQEREVYEVGALKYRTRATYSYDLYGNLRRTSNENDLSTTADDVHTLTSYINDTTQWRIGFPHVERTCPDATCSYTTLQYALRYYDNLPLGEIGARGELTKTSVWRSDTRSYLVTSYAYDASGNELTSTNAAGIVARHNAYDAASGALAAVTDALGNTVSSEYDPVTGLLTAATDANGNTSNFYYDVFGRKHRTETPHDGSSRSTVEESLSYNPNLEVMRIDTDRGPLVTTKHIDGLGRVWKITRTWDNGALIQTETYFDSAGREYKTCAPRLSSHPVDESACITTHLDAAGRVVRVDSPLSGGGFASTTTEYDGYRTVVTDTAGHITITDYDPATLTRTLTQSGGLVTRTETDLLGRVVRITDPGGNVETTTYNSLGWKLTEDDPVTGVATFSYDELGNLVAQTNAAGETTNMYYDDVGRLVRTDYAPLSASSAGAEDTILKYDYLSSPGDIANARGKLVRVQDRSGTTQFAYDVAGRVRTGTKTVDGVQYASTTTYDRSGKRTSVTYPDGSVVGYRYESDAGHLSVITLDGEEVMRYANYTERGAPTSLTYGSHINDVSLTFEASTGQLLQQQDSREFVNNYYEYDQRGMLIEERDVRSSRPNGDTSKAFAYDALGQLVGAAMGTGAACSGASCFGDAWSKRYVYDNVGRVLEKDDKAFSYDVSKRFQLTRVAGESADRTYDAVGRLQSKSSASSTDTYLNGADGFLHEHRRDGTTLHRMTYDYLGNRVKKEFLGAHPQTTWDLGSYKIVHDRSTGKYFHTLYVMGLHGSRIAHRTTQKSGMVAAAAWSIHQDRALASLYEPASLAGFLPWAQHQSAATIKSLVHDIDGANGLFASLAALTMLICIVVFALWWAWELARIAYAWTSGASVQRRRVAWLAPAMLGAMTVACVDKYEGKPQPPATADSIAKDGRYGILQAISRGGAIEPVPGTFYYLNSPLGSTNVMFDAQGAALLRLEYFPDGTVNTAASQGDYIATHTYGQKEYDKELEAYYNAFRYYDAQTMRFTTPDAIKESSDFLVHNVYAYTRNNPVNYTDPSGFLSLRMQIDGPRGGVAAPRSSSSLNYGPLGPLARFPFPPQPRTRVVNPRRIHGPFWPSRTPSQPQAAKPVPRRPLDPQLTAAFNRGPDGARFKRAVRPPNEQAAEELIANDGTVWRLNDRDRLVKISDANIPALGALVIVGDRSVADLPSIAEWYQSRGISASFILATPRKRPGYSSDFSHSAASNTLHRLLEQNRGHGYIASFEARKHMDVAIRDFQSGGGQLSGLFVKEGRASSTLMPDGGGVLGQSGGGDPGFAGYGGFSGRDRSEFVGRYSDPLGPNLGGPVAFSGSAGYAALFGNGGMMHLRM